MTCVLPSSNILETLQQRHRSGPKNDALPLHLSRRSVVAGAAVLTRMTARRCQAPRGLGNEPLDARTGRYFVPAGCNRQI
jgi:hypothetical protein